MTIELPGATRLVCDLASEIKEQEAGEKTADVCRRDAKRLRALEDENGKLKKLLAEQMLDNAMLRDINSKKW